MSLLLSDGLLRIPRHNLSDLQLIHLVSGLDDELAGVGAGRCGGSTELSGYTEWICAGEPRLSLGWDWQLESASSSLRVCRLGLPRTNVLLLENDRTDLPWEQSLHALASYIDALDWNTAAFRAVCERYAA